MSREAGDRGQRSSARLGASRLRFRSLSTEQRYASARGHTRPTALRSPGLLSMMQRSDAWRPARRSTRYA